MTRIFAIFLLMFAIGAPAVAETKPEPKAQTLQKTPPQKATAKANFAEDVAKAEAYLNKLESASARFVQTTHDGTQLVGTFFLNRPGKLRFEYDDPIEDFVVADGFFIYFYDSELGEQTNAPIGQTLADFLLRSPIKLSDDLTVKEVRETKDLTLIEVVQTIDPGAGSLTLGFGKEPYNLKKWRVVDGQGLITEVELFYLEEGLDLPSNLFVYNDPKGRKRFND